MPKPKKYFIKKGNEETGEDVFLSGLQIEMLRLLAEGYKQARIGEKLFRGAKTTHNYFTFLNEIAGCHNPQGLVGWAFKHKILLAESRKIFINPNLPKAE